MAIGRKRSASPSWRDAPNQQQQQAGHATAREFPLESNEGIELGASGTTEEEGTTLVQPAAGANQADSEATLDSASGGGGARRGGWGGH